MENIQQHRINISAPNLLNICVDQKTEGQISGRLYHCYRKDPVFFCDVVELVREAEELFDDLGFPQASTKTRSFAEEKNITATKSLSDNGSLTKTAGVNGNQKVKPEKVLTQQEIMEHMGKKGTFITNVRFRQSSTWQGEVYRTETSQVMRFSNTLDFIKIMDMEIKEDTI